jgi:hypothetical protein
MNEDQMPTLEELRYAPELAALAALNATLETATRALLAAHPELCEDRIPRANVRVVIRGYRLLNMAVRLQVALARYREVAAPVRPLHPDATDDIDALSMDDCDLV